jgi:tripartite-type tricarboxylate transporter receptor subunit TctC
MNKSGGDADALRISAALTMRYRLIFVVAALIVAAWSAAADFPRKPIRIVTADAGGGSDIISRLIGQGWTASWGQQVVVDNRGGGTIAGEIVSRAAPDGYTLLYYGPTLWLLPLMRKEMPYDTMRDFAPVTASARKRPARACPTTDAATANITCVWPPSKSFSAAPVPL